MAHSWLAFGQDTPFLWVSALVYLQGCLSILTTWRPASSRTSDPREQDGSCSGFYDPVSEVTHHHVHHLPLFTQASSESVWEDSTQRCEQQKPRNIWGHLGGWPSHNTTFFIDMSSSNLHNKSLRLISILQRKKLRRPKSGSPAG